MSRPSQAPQDSAPHLTIPKVLVDPAASFWLKDALRSALQRDPVDAANDAEVLATLLRDRCREMLTGSAG